MGPGSTGRQRPAVRDTPVHRRAERRGHGLRLDNECDSNRAGEQRIAPRGPSPRRPKGLRPSHEIANVQPRPRLRDDDHAAGSGGGPGKEQVITRELLGLDAVDQPVNMPSAVGFFPDGSLAYVVNAGSNDLSVIDLDLGFGWATSMSESIHAASWSPMTVPPPTCTTHCQATCP